MGVQLDSGAKKKGIQPHINVTPLVDVVLVLLIIFMVVLPNVQDGKPIHLFKARDAEKSAREECIVVTVAPGPIYLLEEQEMKKERVFLELARLHTQSRDKRLLLRGDVKLPYESIRELLAQAQSLGYKSIDLAVATQKQGWEEP